MMMKPKNLNLYNHQLCLRLVCWCLKTRATCGHAKLLRISHILIVAQWGIIRPSKKWSGQNLMALREKLVRNEPPEEYKQFYWGKFASCVIIIHNCLCQFKWKRPRSVHGNENWDFLLPSSYWFFQIHVCTLKSRLTTTFTKYLIKSIEQ